MIGAKPAVTKFIRPALAGRPDPSAGACSDAWMWPRGFPARWWRAALAWAKPCCCPSWVAERPDARCAWLSCDRWDHDELRIWTSIAAAFASVEPGSVSDALDLLVEGPDDIEDVVASLVNELALWSRPTWLILDDLHVVAPSALAGLATFVERLPETVHVVIGTRVDPVLPIQRWRARGQLAEIRDADLRLEEEDVRTLLEHFGLDLSGGDVQTLTKRTEGWPAGVQLAALSLQHNPDDPSVVHRTPCRNGSCGCRFSHRRGARPAVRRNGGILAGNLGRR